MPFPEMLANHKTRCIATSSGNTGSALAAYCAAAGIHCENRRSSRPPRSAKLQQMVGSMANIYKVRGFGTSSEITINVMEALRRKGGPSAADHRTSNRAAFVYSPIGMAGVKTESATSWPSSSAANSNMFFRPGRWGRIDRWLSCAVLKDLERTNQNRNSACRSLCSAAGGNDTIASALRDERWIALWPISCTNPNQRPASGQRVGWERCDRCLPPKRWNRDMSLLDEAVLGDGNPEAWLRRREFSAEPAGACLRGRRTSGYVGRGNH